MANKIAHYRPKCVEDFKNATDGSINLVEYAEKFADSKKINTLKSNLAELLTSEKFCPEVLEQTSLISRKINHEIERAAFPWRYVNYETGIFGSARLAPDSPEFKEVTQISEGLVNESRIGIITGGGPGIMEAANLGQKNGTKKRQANGKKASTKNRGLLIKLPFEESANDHLDIHDPHSTFGTRLNSFYDLMNSGISWDGGGGTDLENDYGYQLKQVGHLESNFPLILKRSAWEDVQQVKMDKMYYDRRKNGVKELISPEDLKQFTFVDNPDEAIQVVLDHYKNWVKGVFNKLDLESQKMVLQRSS